MSNLFNNFPTSQANLSTSNENLNDVLKVGTIINLDDLVCIHERKEVELTPEQLSTYAKTGKLPSENHYFVFKLILNDSAGNITTKNTSTYTIFNLDVKVGEKTVKLNEWSKRLDDEGNYVADMAVPEDAVIDFSKIGTITVKGFENEYEMRPTVTTTREAMPNFFKKDVHYIEMPDGTKKHFKFASKDHDGSGAIMRKANAEKVDIDYAKIAQLPVFQGAKQLRVASVEVS